MIREISLLKAHPKIRTVVACLITLAALGGMFGFDRVAGWIENGARTFGLELTAPDR